MTIETILNIKNETTLEDGSTLVETHKIIKIFPDEQGQMRTDRKELVSKAFAQIRSKSAVKELLLYCTQLAFESQLD